MTENNTASKLTKKEIANISDSEKRLEAIQENMHLYDGSTNDKPEYNSKEEIQAIADTDKRIKAIKDNINLFKNEGVVK